MTLPLAITSKRLVALAPLRMAAFAVNGIMVWLTSLTTVVKEKRPFPSKPKK